MRIAILTFAALILIGGPALANHTAGHEAALNHITVKVNGLVCDFCARALEKVFYKQDGVEAVDVNLDEHYVKLDVAEGTEMSDDLIKQLITDAGYNVVEIAR